ncbi:MAG: M15 family metallopeptidase [Clostridia bacterium]|nr:M15 family metallopeptidase [Clostridia bacterium]
MKTAFIIIAAALLLVSSPASEDYTFLVNAQNPLPPDHAPHDLVRVRHARAGREDICKMRKAAAQALDEMLDAAAKAGFGDLTVTNGYRCYDYQKYLYYEYYPAKEMRADRSLSYEQALEKVKVYCRAPGESEHQTGLCCDLHDLPTGRQEEFAGTPASEWLEANAHLFGFILRYPRGKEDITGTVYEPWHYRFVGKDAAAFIYENSLTLEEYRAFEETH